MESRHDVSLLVSGIVAAVLFGAGIVALTLSLDPVELGRGIEAWLVASCLATPPIADAVAARMLAAR